MRSPHRTSCMEFAIMPVPGAINVKPVSDLEVLGHELGSVLPVSFGMCVGGPQHLPINEAIFDR